MPCLQTGYHHICGVLFLKYSAHGPENGRPLVSSGEDFTSLEQRGSS